MLPELTKKVALSFQNLARQINSFGAHEELLHKHTVYAPMPDRWSSTSAWGSNSVWGNRIHILTGSSAQKAGGARSCRGPTAAVLYFWTAAPRYTLTLFHNTQLHTDVFHRALSICCITLLAYRLFFVNSVRHIN